MSGIYVVKEGEEQKINESIMRNKFLYHIMGFISIPFKTKYLNKLYNQLVSFLFQTKICQAGAWLAFDIHVWSFGFWPKWLKLRHFDRAWSLHYKIWNFNTFSR
jgi:hypothetical protein